MNELDKELLIDNMRETLDALAKVLDVAPEEIREAIIKWIAGSKKE